MYIVFREDACERHVWKFLHSLEFVKTSKEDRSRWSSDVGLRDLKRICWILFSANSSKSRRPALLSNIFRRSRCFNQSWYFRSHSQWKNRFPHHCYYFHIVMVVHLFYWNSTLMMQWKPFSMKNIHSLVLLSYPVCASVCKLNPCLIVFLSCNKPSRTQYLEKTLSHSSEFIKTSKEDRSRWTPERLSPGWPRRSWILSSAHPPVILATGAPIQHL